MSMSLTSKQQYGHEHCKNPIAQQGRWLTNTGTGIIQFVLLRVQVGDDATQA